MNFEKFRVRVQKNLASNVMDVWILQDRPDGLYIAEPIIKNPSDVKMRQHEEGVISLEPTMRISHFILQELVNELLSIGYTPEREAKNEGKLEAMGNHLQDLRHLLKLPKEVKNERQKS